MSAQIKGTGNSVLGGADLGTPLAEASGGTGVSTFKTALNASGSAPVYACRAWVNFNGTGTVAIRASGNVSSITDNGVGNYTVNFTTAMLDINYGVVSTNQYSAVDWAGAVHVRSMVAGSVTFSSSLVNASLFQAWDSDIISVSVFR